MSLRNKKIITGSHPHVNAVGCGITLVGDAPTGTPVISYFQSDVGYVVVCWQAIYGGRPVYNSDYVHAWRYTQTATYVGMNTCTDFNYTGELWTFNVTTRSAPTPTGAITLFTEGPDASSKTFNGTAARTGATLFAISKETDILTTSVRLHVVDVSTPSAPSLTNTYTPTIANGTRVFLNAYTVSGSPYAALVVNSGVSELDIYDSGGTSQSSTTFNYPLGSEMVGTTLYAATGEASYLIEAWDLSNPASPSPLGNYSTGLDFSNDSLLGVSADGTTVFYAAYVFADDKTYLYAVDFSTPGSPVALGSIVLLNNGSGTFYDLDASSTRVGALLDYAPTLVAHGIDVTSPAAMTNCSPDGQAYYNTAPVTWHAYRLSRRADGDGAYLYGWGDWIEDDAPTSISFDAHLAVYHIT